MKQKRKWQGICGIPAKMVLILFTLGVCRFLFCFYHAIHAEDDERNR